MNLNTFPSVPTLETHRTVEKIPWVALPLLFCKEGQVRVCVGPTCFARVVASYLREPSMAGFHGPNFLLLATAISFFWDSEPLEHALFRNTEKGVLQHESRGQGATGGKNPRKIMSCGFWTPAGSAYLPPGWADLPLPRKTQAQLASFQTLLIILRANSHQAPRGEWFQVTKELHSDGWTDGARCFSHQAVGWGGGNGRMTESRAGQNESLNGIG